MHLLLIANPAAGSGLAVRLASESARVLESAGHEVRIEATEGTGHALELARSVPGDADALIAVGGDGTLHELVNGTLSSAGSARLPLAVLPCGSGDSFARDLGLRSAPMALERLLSGARRRVDVARVEVTSAGESQVHFAINVLVWGAGARINRRAENMRWAGARRYDVATLVELARLPPLAGVPVRNGSPQVDEYLGLASLTRYSGNGLCLAPRAKLDDGLIDVIQIKRGSRLALASVFAAVFRGTHLASPLVEYQQDSRLELALWPGAELVIDGELVRCESMRAEVLPAALEVLA